MFRHVVILVYNSFFSMQIQIQNISLNIITQLSYLALFKYSFIHLSIEFLTLQSICKKNEISIFFNFVVKLITF